MNSIWVFVSIIYLGTAPVQVCPEMKYAFVNKEGCEYAIANSKTLKCIELIVSYAR